MKMEPRRSLPLWLLFFLSFTQLALELVLFHTVQFLYDYLASILYLGLVMAAIGIAGALACLRVSTVKNLQLEILVLFAFSILLVFLGIFKFSHYKILFLILAAVPFLFNALLIALYFSEYSPHQAYAVLLLGACGGLFFDHLMIPILREESLILLLAGVSFLFPLLAFTTTTRWVRGVKIACLIYSVALGFAVYQNFKKDLVNFATGINRAAEDYRNKIYSQNWQHKKLLVSRSSLTARIDAFAEFQEPLGERLKKNQKINVAIGGYSNDHITPHTPDDLWLDRRLPHGLLKDPKVLILGTAAEGITKSAKSLGNNEVTGVEINPAIVDLMTKEFMTLSGNAYEGIKIHAMDGRSFLSRTEEKYDLITLMNTHHVQSAGQVGQPEYLHTQEAFKTYLKHLTEKGVLVLEERNQNRRADVGILKIILTARAAMREMDIADPENHLIIYNYFVEPTHLRLKTSRHFYTGIMIHRLPLTEEQINFYKTWAGTNNYTQRGGYEKDNFLFFSYLPHETLGTALETFILTPDPQRPRWSGFDLREITDDRPFPFKVYRQEKSIHQLVVLLAAALILLIGFATQLSLRGSAGIPSQKIGMGAFYFFLIGVGYMLFEIALLERYQLLADSPSNALLTVLGGFFIFNSIAGFFLSPSLRGPKPLFFLSAVILFVGISYHWVAPFLREAASMLSPLSRFLITIFSLAPVALLLGIPFPAGMTVLGEGNDAGLRSYFFGINGAAAGLGSAVATDIAMHSGITTCLWAAGGCYLLAGGLVLFFKSEGSTNQTRHSAAGSPAW